MDEVAGMRFAPIASDSRSLRFQQGLKDHHASLRLLIAAASVFGALRLDSFSHFSKLRRYSILDPPWNKENRYLIKQTWTVNKYNVECSSRQYGDKWYLAWHYQHVEHVGRKTNTWWAVVFWDSKSEWLKPNYEALDHNLGQLIISLQILIERRGDIFLRQLAS